MIALLQRVKHAKVEVAHETISVIHEGLLVFLGIEKNDDEKKAQHLANRVIHYRIFADEQDKMNLSVKDIHGEILIVPQFTLSADTKKGLRPSFTTAANPKKGEKLFQTFITILNQYSLTIATGQFQANMDVSLCNTGPATFILRA